LNDFASLIDKNPDAQIKITGFPDSSGSIPYKKMISERRAKIVKLYLVEKGMDPIRGKTIVSSSVGELPNQGAEIELLLSEKQQK
jgi:outer membrane protein OmpA-like peptidoglycan-associated protein